MYLIFSWTIYCIFGVNMLNICCWSHIVKISLLKPVPSMSKINYSIFYILSRLEDSAKKRQTDFFHFLLLNKDQRSFFLTFFSLLCYYSDSKILPCSILITCYLCTLSLFSFYYIRVLFSFNLFWHLLAMKGLRHSYY